MQRYPPSLVELSSDESGNNDDGDEVNDENQSQFTIASSPTKYTE